MPFHRDMKKNLDVTHSRLQVFASLRWYEACITFLFTFTAKTSELLLAAGLVVSTANFLTDGAVIGSNVELAHAWAWAQALAIDSSLGVTFYYIFHCIKQRDWIKAILYGLLTLLLAIVAGTITNVDTFSHALHTTIASAMTQVGLDVKILTTLRAVAVVGFVMMSRLKDVSFKELYEAPTSSLARPSYEPKQQLELTQEREIMQRLRAHIPAEMLEQVMKSLAQEGTTTITEEREAAPISLPAPPTKRKRQSQPAQDEPKSEAQQEVTLAAKLEQAFQELQAEGARISGRALAKRAHIHRLTCNQWLRERQPEGKGESEFEGRGDENTAG